MRHFVIAAGLMGAFVFATAAFAHARDPAAEAAMPPAAGEPAAPADVASPPPASAAAEPGEDEYVVKQGDTLSAIAERLTGKQDNWRAIAQANQLGDPDDLEVGQRLKIPADLKAM